jgi:hypothetical protein
MSASGLTLLPKSCDGTVEEVPSRGDDPNAPGLAGDRSRDETSSDSDDPGVPDARGPPARTLSRGRREFREA